MHIAKLKPEKGSENTLFQMIEDADRLFYAAKEHYDNGAVSAAAEAYQQILDEYPNHGKSLAHLAEIFISYYKNPSQAEDLIRKAIQNEPSYTTSYFLFADLLLEQERYSELIAVLNKVKEIPGVAKDFVLKYFALLNEMQGNYDQAIDFFKQAIRKSLSNKNITEFAEAIDRCNLKKQID
ncbi:MAG: tetratricopeptide repeat protein [Bacteroidia bacterium]|nr:tetratricopeptide repeat protein [Bacteroidia bacterium]